jgi:hypothetical protein
VKGVVRVAPVIPLVEEQIERLLDRGLPGVHVGRGQRIVEVSELLEAPATAVQAAVDGLHVDEERSGDLGR